MPYSMQCLHYFIDHLHQCTVANGGMHQVPGKIKNKPTKKITHWKHCVLEIHSGLRIITFVFMLFQSVLTVVV